MSLSILKPRFPLIVPISVALITSIGVATYYQRLLLREKRGFTAPVAMQDTSKSVSDGTFKKQYSFTEDWFTNNAKIWEAALSDYVGKPGLRYLEVGVFEGRSVMWMIENVLTHPTSELTCMDLFAGDYQNQYPDFAKRYFANLELSGAASRVKNITGYSQIELRKLPLNTYDIIYIDGSHENHDVLEDAILSHRLLKSDGILIFDDYHRQDDSYGAPKFGIDTFMRFYGDNYRVIHNDNQLLLKKFT